MDEPVVSDPTAIEPTKDEKSMAMLAHVLGILGFLVPLIIYAVKGNESKFVAYHAMQSLVFQLIYLAVVFIVILPIAVCTFGLGYLLLLPLIPLVIGACIWVGLKANNGEWVGYPLIDQIGLPK